MQDRLESLALVGSLEHQGSHAGPVQAALSVEHRSPERLHQLGDRRPVRLRQLVRDPVRIDQAGTELAEAVGHRGLAAADAAGDRHAKRRAGRHHMDER